MIVQPCGPTPCPVRTPPPPTVSAFRSSLISPMDLDSYGTTLRAVIRHGTPCVVYPTNTPLSRGRSHATRAGHQSVQETPRGTEDLRRDTRRTRRTRGRRVQHTDRHKILAIPHTTLCTRDFCTSGRKLRIQAGRQRASAGSAKPGDDCVGTRQSTPQDGAGAT